MPDKIRVAIVDDHPMMREGIALALRSAKDFEVVAHGESADDAIRICREDVPDIMFLDISMPGSGLTAASAITANSPAVKIVMLTVFEDEHHVNESLRSGARGYVVKGVSGSELIQTARSVADGECYISPALAARILREIVQTTSSAATQGSGDPSISELGTRTDEVLRLLADGFNSTETAERLGISEEQVKRSLSTMLARLHGQNATASQITTQPDAQASVQDADTRLRCLSLQQRARGRSAAVK